MDKPTRNQIQKATQDARTLLETEFSEQLEALFDIHSDGTVAPEPGSHLDAAQRIIRQKIVAAIAHEKAGGMPDRDAVAAYLREASFTCLNRFVALKMLEARDLTQQCISKGELSSGFKEFCGLAPGLAELPDRGYRLYIESLFDELSTEIRVLFDRLNPASLLWPRKTALDGLLSILNRQELDEIWGEDETIGWVYQYFNSADERKKMRDESAAPRNSHELAVRNQFFTPRYVVEFLTDNTLGRVWYEMTQGQTVLKDTCRYLVRRPDEVFLDDTHSPEDAKAKRWLQGVDEDLPTAYELACTVDAYKRHPSVDAAADWLYKNITRVTAGETSDLKTQELLDLLFMLHRADHFSEGTLDHYSTEVKRIIDELAERRNQGKSDNQTQEDLLNQAVFIPYRKLKDPREILMLDPACGSMHFGLYAFDLFEIIYRESLSPKFRFREKLLSTVGWAGASELTIFPSSVKLKDDATAYSDYLGQQISVDDAYVLVASEPDVGEGVRADCPYIVKSETKFRVPLSHRVPLIQFDYEKAVRKGWFSARFGDDFVKYSGCFVYQEPLNDHQAEEQVLTQIPRMIIENNIHGIDIDPRAVQIAALSLWLRAQKSWKNLGTKATARPLIAKSNVVTAEPMPGEYDMRREFVARVKPRVIGQLVDVVFEKMKFAGEAGSLLKIEEEIKDAVATAKTQWEEQPKPEQMELFAGTRSAILVQQKLRFDTEGITDQRFWEEAEDRILGALEDYAEQAENGMKVGRSLFAQDAARGFAFINLCRNRYDVVLMNPPFGDASLPSKPYIEDTYGDTKGDVYKAFVECFHARLVPSGYLGIISSRTGFFLGQSEDWRTRVVLRLFRPIVLADLGSGVLDAMVEVAAYVLRNLSEKETRNLTISLVPGLKKVVRDKQDCFSIPKWQVAQDGLKRHQAVAELERLVAEGFIKRCPGDIVRYAPLWRAVKNVTAPPPPVYPSLICVRATGAQDKEGILKISATREDKTDVFVCNPSSFLRMPSCTFSYWISPAIIALFDSLPKVQAEGREAVIGSSTKDDFRFLRLSWETQNRQRAIIGNDKLVIGGIWIPFAKGGAVVRYYGDLNLMVNWSGNGAELKAMISEYRGSRGWGYQWSAELKPRSFSFRPGLTWGRRSTSLAFRVMDSNTMFADKGPAILEASNSTESLLALLAILNSKAFIGLASLQVARVSLAQSFEIGIIQSTPVPVLNNAIVKEFGTLSKGVWFLHRYVDTARMTSNMFTLPVALSCTGITLIERAAVWAAHLRTNEETVTAIQAEIDDFSYRIYGLGQADRVALAVTLTTGTKCEAGTMVAQDDEAEVVPACTPGVVVDLLSYCIGCAFGRWDFRIAIDHSLAPKLPDPFDPLPVCQPGILVGLDGLPAEPNQIVSEEWLRARPDANTLPPEGAVLNPTITDDEYPLRISWNGILVDDPGFEGEQLHEKDIVLRCSEVLELLWKDRAHDIEQEACEILKIAELREFFRKSFFTDHIKRYSKSRRKAPIYWQLSTPSASYSIWLYYHRFTKDTFYRVLNEYVVPKLQFEERELNKIRQQYGINSTAGQRKELASREAFVAELSSFKEDVARIAPLWNPDLNDGVIINFAPLWRLVPQNKAWQKECMQVWDKLADGEYDWAHLAMHLWPERVVPKCAKDRSLAIAHGLDEVFWQEDEKGKAKPTPVSGETVKALVQERTSPTVKAALEDLLKAPAPATMAKKKRKKKA